jgi:uncharacterized protein YbjT (DUF2867 family)
MQRMAVIAGASGLVGQALLERLLAVRRYRRVVALVRRPLAIAHDRLVEAAADYDDLSAALGSIVDRDSTIDVFCCLGSTLRTAGSRAAFRRVDHDFVVALGRWALSVGARRLIVVSALGADPRSRVFYNRVKGETERDLRALGLPSLVLARPSLLVGDRTEFRLGERLAQLASRPLRALLPAAVRPIAAVDVAQAMLDAALQQQPPTIIESAAMQGAAGDA